MSSQAEIHRALLQLEQTVPRLAELSSGLSDSERDANIFGRRHTVFTQARRMAKHEAEHCAQLQILLG